LTDQAYVPQTPAKEFFQLNSNNLDTFAAELLKLNSQDLEKVLTNYSEFVEACTYQGDPCLEQQYIRPHCLQYSDDNPMT
jgi:hypothetical protein